MPQFHLNPRGVFTFTYNIIEFDWDEEIDGLSVTLHPRAWNSRRTRFEADEQRLGGKNPNFRLACSNFPKLEKPSASSASRTRSVSSLKTETTTSGPTVSMIPLEPLEGEPQAMPQNSGGYETARLRFFRDLFEGERLRILLTLDALPENFNEKVSLGLERRLLDMLVRDGKLAEIEKMIDHLIEERKGGAK